MASAASRPGCLRVLLADDERAIAITLGDAIEEAGHAVTVVRDGLAAVRALDAEAFDVVVSDVRMPGLDGMGVLRHALSLDPRPEVVLVTGSGPESSAREAMAAGALALVRKPFYNEEILGLLERVRQADAVEVLR